MLNGGARSSLAHTLLSICAYLFKRMVNLYYLTFTGLCFAKFIPDQGTIPNMLKQAKGRNIQSLRRSIADL
jgi:hypothetical protein